MHNVNLNAGGFIGAACGAALGGAVGYLISTGYPAEAYNEQAQAVGSGFIGGLIAFALGGNFLWAQLRGK